ncbi:hypothetical protein QR685DRAFT_453357, partial [Neurospora intermedia]
FNFNITFLIAAIPNNIKYYIKQLTVLNKLIFNYSKENVFNTLVLVFKEAGFILISINSYLLTNRVLGALLVLYVDDLLIAVLIITIVN